MQGSTFTYPRDRSHNCRVGTHAVWQMMNDDLWQFGGLRAKTAVERAARK
jgi:hypothetical protein